MSSGKLKGASRESIGCLLAVITILFATMMAIKYFNIQWLTGIVALISIFATIIAVVVAFSKQTEMEPVLKNPNVLENNLSLFFKADKYDWVINKLQKDLPQWDLSAQIIESARELCQLKKIIGIAKAKDTSKELVESFEKDTESGAAYLWHLADRVAAFKNITLPAISADSEKELGSHNFVSPIEQHFDTLSKKLESLSIALQESRETLIIYIISSAASTMDIRSIETRLQSLNDAVAELNSISF